MIRATEIAAPADALLQDAAALLRAGKWDEGGSAVDAALAAGAKADGAIRLLLAIADVRQSKAEPASITPEMVGEGDALDVRRLLVNPLVQRGALADAVVVLDAVVTACPPAQAEFLQRAGLLARLDRWDAAIADVDHVGQLDPGNAMVRGVRLQYRLRGGRAAEVAAMARDAVELPTDERQLNFMLVALFRVKDFAGAAQFAGRIPAEGVDDPILAGNIVQAYFRAGDLQTAIDVGERFVDSLLDGGILRSHLGQAWLEGGPTGKRSEKAIEHFEVGLAFAPDDLRMISLLGQLLLRGGKTARALPYLARAVDKQPAMSELRALYARALKQEGRSDEAAEQFVTLVGRAPNLSGSWTRYAAGALAQAGRREEAAAMYDAWVASRGEGLPEGFSEGLDALWGKLDKVRIPQARLDWAWSLRSPDCQLDRAEWERRAKWGNLADHYLLDWLECRDQQVEEAMYHFADELDFLERFLGEARARAPGKGVVFASGHVGAMYFGPLALELLGERSRWLASTPSVARTSYTDSLISTSDQTDAQVARAFMKALREDYTVVVVVDGAINLAAPRVGFEGQEVTYSQFAARMAYRMGSSSAFVAPVWREGNHLGFVLEHLPMPEAGESADDYAQRWQDAYFLHLRRFLSGPPECLRMSGGIWRHIR